MDVRGGLTLFDAQHVIWLRFLDFSFVRAVLQTLQCDPISDDIFTDGIWKCLTKEDTRFLLSDGIWKTRASPRCKNFMWRTMNCRLWASDRRFRPGLQDQTSTCFFCRQEEDNADHILLQCVVARGVWHICRQKFELNIEESQRRNTLP
jgi:hypothetical protein